MGVIATPNKIKLSARLSAGFQSPRCIGVIDKIAASTRLNRPPKSAFKLAKADMSLHSHNVCLVPIPRGLTSQGTAFNVAARQP